MDIKKNGELSLCRFVDSCDNKKTTQGIRQIAMSLTLCIGYNLANDEIKVLYDFEVKNRIKISAGVCSNLSSKITIHKTVSVT